jgi:hypothetical protein
MCGNDTRRSLLAVGEFGMFVKVAPPRDNVVLERRDSLLDCRRNWRLL